MDLSGWSICNTIMFFFSYDKSLAIAQLFKDGKYFEEITKSSETHPKVERF
jgi:hypothetical protein